MITDKDTRLAELRGMLTSVEIYAQKKDLSRLRLMIGRLGAWGRDLIHHLHGQTALHCT